MERGDGTVQTKSRLLILFGVRSGCEGYDV
jgi:hypothetical protein